jgi:diguanylate cyclase (GGDEF)-like protein
LSLILGDIDYFKRYNDTYGHQAGDECLRQVARAMNRAVKRAPDLVARYGGEEFAIILPNTESEGAMQVAYAVREAVGMLKIEHSQSSVNEYVTLSLGVACTVPDREHSPDILVAAADKAMYEAKARGRNRIILKTFGKDSDNS